MSPISIECCRVTEVPWAAGRAADGGRPCLLTPEYYTEVMADACRDSLPRLTPHTDKDGTRQATLLFPQGAQATMRLPDGSTQPLTSLRVRVTEYTVGEHEGHKGNAQTRDLSLDESPGNRSSA